MYIYSCLPLQDLHTTKDCLDPLKLSAQIVPVGIAMYKIVCILTKYV